MAREREGASLLTVTENGFGKKTALSEYRMQSRGGMGLTNYKVDEEYGAVCGIKVVDETDDLCSFPATALSFVWLAARSVKWDVLQRACVSCVSARVRR